MALLVILPTNAHDFPVLLVYFIIIFSDSFVPGFLEYKSELYHCLELMEHFFNFRVLISR